MREEAKGGRGWFLVLRAWEVVAMWFSVAVGGEGGLDGVRSDGGGETGGLPVAARTGLHLGRRARQAAFS